MRVNGAIQKVRSLGGGTTSGAEHGGPPTPPHQPLPAPHRSIHHARYPATPPRNQDVGLPPPRQLMSIPNHGLGMARTFADADGPADSSSGSQGAYDDVVVPAVSSPVSLFSTGHTSLSLPMRPSASMTMRASSQHGLQVSSAQKDVDDPNTPIDSQRDTEASHSDRTMTAPSVPPLSSHGDMFMTNSHSGIPSYANASGPLHLRGSAEAITLPEHLYTRGFIQGRHSDITVTAFGHKYNLHRLILDRAPFFSTALSEPWRESTAKEISVYPGKVDHNITRAAFELAIKKLYGYDISKECDSEAVGLFAAGCWLEMQDLVDTAIEAILRQMASGNLASLIRLVTSNYYGRSGERILESAKAMLSRSGWEMPLRYWDGIPGDIIREVVGSDGFFVFSEWDRFVLAKRLLDRRLRQTAVELGLIERGKTPLPQAPDSLRLNAIRFDSVYRRNSMTVSQSGTDLDASWISLYTNIDVERIFILLDEGIHYLHMEYEQLDFIRSARDIFGLPVLPERVISNALWQQLTLRQKVLSADADESSQVLGLCKTPQEPSTNETTTISKEKQKGPAYEEDEESDTEHATWDGTGKPRKFWIPSSDCNIVLGNGAEPMVTTSTSFQRHVNQLSATMQPEDAQWATDFASSPATMANPNTRTDHPKRPISAGGTNAGQPKPIMYTEFPPFRFSVEFPNPSRLKEKKRVYSRTVAYAGSLWNIYIQKVRTAKNVQLGVYLHRAKERDTEEQAHGISQQSLGSVDERIGQLERGMLLRGGRSQRRRSTRDLQQLHRRSEDDESGSSSDPQFITGHDNSITLSGSGGRHHSSSNLAMGRWSGSTLRSPLRANMEDGRLHSAEAYSASEEESADSSDDEPASAYPNPSLSRLAPRQRGAAVPTLPSYVDRRPTIKTYFKIYSPSKGGRVLSIYESAPDRFNFSQSWGWKSSTLMLDENCLDDGEAGEDEGKAEKGPNGKKNSSDGKLRFMVVIGNL